jgi:hypothetical protein
VEFGPGELRFLFRGWRGRGARLLKSVPLSDIVAVDRISRFRHSAAGYEFRTESPETDRMGYAALGRRTVAAFEVTVAAAGLEIRDAGLGMSLRRRLRDSKEGGR